MIRPTEVSTSEKLAGEEGFEPSLAGPEPARNLIISIVAALIAYLGTGRIDS